MLRKFAGFIAVIALLAVGVPTVGAEGRTQHYGPFASTSLDGGTCGQPWATDTFNCEFMVKDNKDGSFQVREEFKDGTFVTTGPASPGACETTDTRHGTIVRAGVTGSFHGDLEGVVTGGTYNPNACSASPSPCTTTLGFIGATFPGGTFSVTTFRFHYAAGGQGLIYHEWTDESNKDPNGPEVFKGDIANV